MKRPNNENKNETVKQKSISLEEIGVSRVKEWPGENGKAGRVTFDLELNGLVKLYGLRVETTRDGEDFIAFPARQGKDGKWYNYYYLQIDDKSKKVIIGEVERQLNGN